VPITAAWHTSLVVPAADPFDVPVTIEDVGVPIVLSADGQEAELRAELCAAVEAEVDLAEHGVECKIKDGYGVSCFACPLFDPVDALCQLGREQQRIVTELQVVRRGGRRQ
jgi:hypothetical protein